MKTRKSRPVKPQVELLEDRTVPAVIEGFEGANLTAWTAVLRNTASANTNLSAAAAHDGAAGLLKTDGYEWLLRNDAAVQVGQGQTFSVWIRFADQADGRAYFAFGATPNSRGGTTGTGGALSLVLAANSDEFMFQRNSQQLGDSTNPGYFKGFSHDTIGIAASQSYLPNKWYKAEVTWEAGGALTGRLYDSDGTTLLNTVTANSSSARLALGNGQTSGQLTPLTAGGIGLRAFGSPKHFDTFEVTGTPVTTSTNVGRTLIPVFTTRNTARVSGQFGLLPYQYTARPGTQLDVQLDAYDQLQQVAIVGSQVGLTMRNISRVNGTLNLDMQQGWGPIVFGLQRTETPVETSILQHYLLRQRPGEPTQVIGSSDGKHFFDSAQTDFQHLRPGVQDTYATSHNSNRNFYTPANQIDPVTGQVPNKDFFGNFGGGAPRTTDGVNIWNPRSFSSSIQHLLTANVADVDPAQNPEGTRWFIMGNLWVVGDQNVSNNSRWVEVRPSFSGTSFSFTVLGGGQLDFRTIPGLTLESAPVVTGLVKTPTGLVITFSQPIDPSSLNLYDGPAGTRGQPDLVVTGPNGPVRGSVVVDPSGTRLTFIKTGGVMEVGSYTVTLRSSSTAFKASTGILFDGDSDGSPGGDYTGTFTVAPPPPGTSIPVTISIPDFARGPGQDVDLPASSADSNLRLRIQIAGATVVNSASLTLNYNPNLLTISDVIFPAGVTGTFNLSTPGVLPITANFLTPAVDGAEFVQLIARVPNSAADFYKTKHVLDLTTVRFNGNLLAIDDDGLHLVAYPGDTNANGGINAGDATRALQFAVGLGSGYFDLPLTDGDIVSDINGTGGTTSGDATNILRKGLGLSAPLIPDLPEPPLTIMPGPIDPFLNIPKTFRARPGGVLTVPVNVDYSEGLQSADFAISFDPARLEVVSVQRGRLTRDFDVMAMNLDSEAGTLQLGMVRTAGPVSGRGKGSVLRITFRVKADAPAGPTIINLRRDIGPTLTQLNDGDLDLIPDPTNEAGDRLDGLIKVLANRKLTPRPEVGNGAGSGLVNGTGDLLNLLARKRNRGVGS